MQYMLANIHLPGTREMKMSWAQNKDNHEHCRHRPFVPICLSKILLWAWQNSLIIIFKSTHRCGCDSVPKQNSWRYEEVVDMSPEHTRNKPAALMLLAWIFYPYWSGRPRLQLNHNDQMASRNWSGRTLQYIYVLTNGDAHSPFLILSILFCCHSGVIGMAFQRDSISLTFIKSSGIVLLNVKSRYIAFDFILVIIVKKSLASIYCGNTCIMS